MFMKNTLVIISKIFTILFDNVQIDSAKIDDRIMGLPGTANDFGPNLVWIRQDWLDDLDVHWTKMAIMPLLWKS